MHKVILVLALSLLPVLAIAQEHKSGELTETQRLKMQNLDLQEYSRKSEVRQAEQAAQLAGAYAEKLEADFPKQQQAIAGMREKLIQEIEASNPGWHWQHANPQDPNDHPGLRKDSAAPKK
jgi:hypothetical protein